MNVTKQCDHCGKDIEISDRFTDDLRYVSWCLECVKEDGKLLEDKGLMGTSYGSSTWSASYNEVKSLPKKTIASKPEEPKLQETVYYNVWYVSQNRWTNHTGSEYSNGFANPNNPKPLTLEQAKELENSVCTAGHYGPGVFEIRAIADDGKSCVSAKVELKTEAAKPEEPVAKVVQVENQKPEETKPVHYNIWYKTENRWANSSHKPLTGTDNIINPIKLSKDEADKWVKEINQSEFEVRQIAEDGKSCIEPTPIPEKVVPVEAPKPEVETISETSKEDEAWYNIWFEKGSKNYWTAVVYAELPGFTNKTEPVKLTLDRAKELLATGSFSSRHSIRAIAKDGITSINLDADFKPLLEEPKPVASQEVPKPAAKKTYYNIWFESGETKHWSGLSYVGLPGESNKALPAKLTLEEAKSIFRNPAFSNLHDYSIRAIAEDEASSIPLDQNQQLLTVESPKPEVEAPKEEMHYNIWFQDRWDSHWTEMVCQELPGFSNAKEPIKLTLDRAKAMLNDPEFINRLSLYSIRAIAKDGKTSIKLDANFQPIITETKVEASKEVSTPIEEITEPEAHYNLWYSCGSNEHWTETLIEELPGKSNREKPIHLTLERAKQLFEHGLFLSDRSCYSIRAIAADGVGFIKLPEEPVKKAITEAPKPEAKETYYNIWYKNGQSWTELQQESFSGIIWPLNGASNRMAPKPLTLEVASELFVHCLKKCPNSYEIRAIAEDGKTSVPSKVEPIIKAPEVVKKISYTAPETHYNIWCTSGFWTKDKAAGKLPGDSNENNPVKLTLEQASQIISEFDPTVYEIRAIAADGVNSVAGRVEPIFKESEAAKETIAPTPETRYNIWYKNGNRWTIEATCGLPGNSNKDNPTQFTLEKATEILNALILNGTFTSTGYEIRAIAEDGKSGLPNKTKAEVIKAPQEVPAYYNIWLKGIEIWTGDTGKGYKELSGGANSRNPVKLTLDKVTTVFENFLADGHLLKDYEIRQIAADGVSSITPTPELSLLSFKANQASKPKEEAASATPTITYACDHCSATIASEDWPRDYSKQPCNIAWCKDCCSTPESALLDSKTSGPGSKTSGNRGWIAPNNVEAIKNIPKKSSTPLPITCQHCNATLDSKDLPIGCSVYWCADCATTDSLLLRRGSLSDRGVTHPSSKVHGWFDSYHTTKIAAIPAKAHKEAVCDHCGKSLSVPTSLPFTLYWCNECVTTDKQLLNDKALPVERDDNSCDEYVGWKNYAASAKSLPKKVTTEPSLMTTCDHCNAKLTTSSFLADNNCSVVWCESCHDTDSALIEESIRTSSNFNVFRDIGRHVGWTAKNEATIKAIPKKIVEATKPEIKHECDHCGKAVEYSSWFKENECVIFWCKECIATESLNNVGRPFLDSANNRGWQAADLATIRAIPKKTAVVVEATKPVEVEAPKPKMVACVCCGKQCKEHDSSHQSVCRDCSIKVKLQTSQSVATIRTDIAELQNNKPEEGMGFAGYDKEIAAVKKAQTDILSEQVPCFCCGNETRNFNKRDGKFLWNNICPLCANKAGYSENPNGEGDSHLQKLAEIKLKLKEEAKSFDGKFVAAKTFAEIMAVQDEYTAFASKYPKLEAHSSGVLVRRILTTLGKEAYGFGSYIRNMAKLSSGLITEIDLYYSSHDGKVTLQLLLNKLKDAGFTIEASGDISRTTIHNSGIISSRETRAIKDADGHSIQVNLHTTSSKEHDNPWMLNDVDLNRIYFDSTSKNYRAAPGYDLDTILQHLKDRTFQLPLNGVVPDSITKPLIESGFKPLTEKPQMPNTVDALKYGDVLTVKRGGETRKATVIEHDSSGNPTIALDYSWVGSWTVENYGNAKEKEGLAKLPNASDYAAKAVCWRWTSDTELVSMDGNVLTQVEKSAEPMNAQNLHLGDKIEFEHTFKDIKYKGEAVVVQEAPDDVAIFVLNNGVVKSEKGEIYTISGWTAKRLPKTEAAAKELNLSAESKTCYLLDSSTKAMKVLDKFVPLPIAPAGLNVGDRVEIEVNLKSWNTTRTDEKVTRIAVVIGHYSGNPYFAVEGGLYLGDGSKNICSLMTDDTNLHNEAKRLKAPVGKDNRTLWLYSSATIINKVLEKAPDLIDVSTLEVGDLVEIECSTNKCAKAVVIEKQNGTLIFAYEKPFAGYNLSNPTTAQLPLLAKYAISANYNIYTQNSSTKIRAHLGKATAYLDPTTIKIGDEIEVEIKWSGTTYPVRAFVADIVNGAHQLLVKKIEGVTGSVQGTLAYAAEALGYDTKDYGSWQLQKGDLIKSKITNHPPTYRSWSDCKVGDLVKVEVDYNGVKFEEEAVVGAVSSNRDVSLILKNRRDVAANCPAGGELEKVAAKYGLGTEATVYAVNWQVATLKKIVGKATVVSIPDKQLKAGDLVEACFGHEASQQAVVIQSADESPYGEPVLAFLKPQTQGWPLDASQKALAARYGLSVNEKIGRRADGMSTFVTKVIGQKGLSVTGLKLGDRIEIETGQAYKDKGCTLFPSQATVLNVDGTTAYVVFDEVYRDAANSLGTSNFPTAKQLEDAKKANISLKDTDARVFAFSDGNTALILKKVLTSTAPSKKEEVKVETTLNPQALQTGDRVLVSITDAKINGGKALEVEGTALGIEHNGNQLIFLDEELTGAFVFQRPDNVKACQALGFDPAECRGWAVSPSNTKLVGILEEKGYVDLEALNLGDRVLVEYTGDGETISTKEATYLGRDNDGDHNFYVEEEIVEADFDSFYPLENEVPFRVLEKLEIDPDEANCLSQDFGNLKVRKVLTESTLELTQEEIEEELIDEGHEITPAEEYQTQEAIEEAEKVLKEAARELGVIDPEDLEAGDKIKIEIGGWEDGETRTRKATVLTNDGEGNVLVALDKAIAESDEEVGSTIISQHGREAIKAAKKFKINPEKNVAWEFDEWTTVSKLLSKDNDNNQQTTNGEEDMPYDEDGNEVTVMEMVKQDSINAGYRVCATQMTKGVKGAILLAMKDKGMAGGKIEAISEMLDTEIGAALISAGLGYGIAYLPGGIGEDPRIQKLSQEFRVGGIAQAGNSIVGSVLDMIMPAITDAMKTLPPLPESKVTVAKPARKRIAKTANKDGGGELLEMGNDKGGKGMTAGA